MTISKVSGKKVVVYVFHCVSCKEDFESDQNQHREQCPSCHCLCSVKSSYTVEE